MYKQNIVWFYIFFFVKPVCWPSLIIHYMVAAGFLSHYLSGPLPYVRYDVP